MLFRAGLNLRGRHRDLVDGIKVLVQDLVHGEHVYAVLLEHRTHRVVAANLSLVAGVLQVARFDVLPDLLDGLWS